MRLRRKVRDLEARLAVLEAKPPVSYEMPPRPWIDSEPVNVRALWRERTDDYAKAAECDTDNAWRAYL